jgi:periplasmic divalent cation tolerance protein
MVHITCPDLEAARALASDLVEKDLCACVNIVNGIESVYKWDGKVNID